MDDEVTEIRVAMTIVGFFSLAGIVGNALVLNVFCRCKPKLTSTVFILTLAGTDFVTSLFTMPFTIVMELLNFDIRYDALCKLHGFLITSTIPFSAFINVAIAVDRYHCIVHPFRRNYTMTVQRAKIISFTLAMAAISIGIICSLTYGVYYKTHNDQIQLFPENISVSDYITNVQNSSILAEEHNSSTNLTNNAIVYSGFCNKNDILISNSIFYMIQRIYASLFGICAVTVICLYASIYYKLHRRQQAMMETKSCCVTCLPISTKDDSNNHATLQTRKSSSNSIKKGIRRDSSLLKQSSSSHGNVILHERSISIDQKVKLRMSNIRTVVMLSLVAFTFIVAFLPAWLMALKAVKMNVIIFYLHFLYNVSNPVIYVFVNRSFWNQVKRMFICYSKQQKQQWRLSSLSSYD